MNGVLQNVSEGSIAEVPQSAIKDVTAVLKDTEEHLWKLKETLKEVVVLSHANAALNLKFKTLDHEETKHFILWPRKQPLWCRSWYLLDTYIFVVRSDNLYNLGFLIYNHEGIMKVVEIGNGAVSITGDGEII